MDFETETHKKRYENILYDLYAKFRQFDAQRVRAVNNISGVEQLDVDSLNNIESKPFCAPNESAMQAVMAFHHEKLTVRQISERMRISRFDVYVHLLDYVWNEKDQIMFDYNITPLICEAALERDSVDALSSSLKSIAIDGKSCPPLFDLMTDFICEPFQMMIMLTILLVQLHGWPIAYNIDWSVVENYSVSSSEDLESMAKIFADVSSAAISGLNEIENENVRNMSAQSQTILDKNHDEGNECLAVIAEVVKNLAGLRSNLDVLPSMKVLPQPEIGSHISTLTKQEKYSNALKETYRPSLVNIGSSRIPKLSSALKKHSDHAHLVGTMSSSSCTIISEDEIGADLKKNDICMAKRENKTDFVRCQVVSKVDLNLYRMKFDDHHEENVNSSNIARIAVHKLDAWEGVRVCALFQPRRDSKYRRGFYSGIVAVGLHYFMNNQLLIFFDVGLDAYVDKSNVFALMEQKRTTVNGKLKIDRMNNWKLMAELRKSFVRHYMNKYPDWPMVSMKRKENTQRVNVLRHGVPNSAFVLEIDRHFALLRFPQTGHDGQECVAADCRRHKHIDEWIYRGSDRLQIIRNLIEKIEKQEDNVRLGMLPCPGRSRREFRVSQHFEYSMPIQGIQNIRPHENTNSMSIHSDSGLQENSLNANADDYKMSSFSRRQTARKGQAIPQVDLPPSASDIITFRRNRKARIRGRLEYEKIPLWSEHHFVEHSECSSSCLRRLDKDPYDETLSGHSPYMLPLLTGWNRMTVTLVGRRKKKQKKTKTPASYCQYSAPCGRHLYSFSQLTRYLGDTDCMLTIDLFTFDPDIRPNVIYRSPHLSKLMDDFSRGREAVRIPVVNAEDDDQPPEMIYYRWYYPYNDSTDISTISSDYCSGCSCTDNCSDEETCECRQLTKAEILRLGKSIQPAKARGYSYRNLALADDEWYLSGIYECNSRCSCSQSKCFNRVVQQRLKIPLELFKTREMGWGVRTLVDVPKGIFICTYTGAILTDAQAEIVGKQTTDGDKYFADLNLVDNVEDRKLEAGIDLNNDAGFSDDELDNESLSPPDSSARSAVSVGFRRTSVGEDKYDSGQESSCELAADGSEQTSVTHSHDTHDTSRSKKLMELELSNEGEKRRDMEHCAAKTSSNREIRSIDFVKVSSQITEQSTQPDGRSKFDLLQYIDDNGGTPLYTIDARLKGNIGRFLNHSCSPNVAVHRAFVDTHDIRLPWIAFFTCTKVFAGSELLWDYGYTEGNVEGKTLMCKCGARNCRGRLL